MCGAQVHLKGFLLISLSAVGVALKKGFSLYEIERFLREAGAEKINEKAVLSFEKELADTVTELVNEAQIYANYAGRKKHIKDTDVEFIRPESANGRALHMIAKKKRQIRRQSSIKCKAGISNGRVMLE